MLQVPYFAVLPSRPRLLRASLEEMTRMTDAFQSNFALLDRSAYFVIAAIVVLLVLGVLVTVALRARYGSLSLELRRSGDGDFRSAVLIGIVRETVDALERGAAEVNTQAIIEHNFQRRIKLLLVGERFVKSSTGLLIILGLVGTFYGLTLSIGKLVALVSADATGGADIAEGLTQGLTQALSGMSVAFTTSLFGIISAIVMTLLGVFLNVTDMRVALMVEIEAFLDNHLLRVDSPAAAQAAPGRGATLPHGPGAVVNPVVLQQVERGLSQSVSQLNAAVGQFEAALSAFSTTTRDFREFNLHLKDNVQRLSLSFADLSNTLSAHIAALSQAQARRDFRDPEQR